LLTPNAFIFLALARCSKVASKSLISLSERAMLFLSSLICLANWEMLVPRAIMWLFGCASGSPSATQHARPSTAAASEGLRWVLACRRAVGAGSLAAAWPLVRPSIEREDAVAVEKYADEIKARYTKIFQV
jgi:hypothetical protein